MGIFSKYSDIFDSDEDDYLAAPFPDDTYEIIGETFVAKFNYKGNFELNRFDRLVNIRNTKGCKQIEIEIGAQVEQSYLYVATLLPVVKYTVDEDNKYYRSIDGNLYSKDGKALYKYAHGSPETCFIIPDGVEVIDTCAFSDAKNLSEVIFPHSMRVVKMHAFCRCCNVTSVSLNEGLTVFGNGAFLDCLKLKSVAIPSTLVDVGISPFAACSSLSEICVSEKNEIYKSIDGVLYSKNGTELVQYPAGKKDADFTVPLGVTKICEAAFQRCRNLDTVEITDSVTCLGNKAFDACGKMTSIFIPKSVKSIGSFAFRGCDELTIFCEAPEEQRGWFGTWNFSDCPVEWGEQD